MKKDREATVGNAQGNEPQKAVSIHSLFGHMPNWFLNSQDERLRDSGSDFAPSFLFQDNFDKSQELPAEELQKAIAAVGSSRVRIVKTRFRTYYFSH